MTTDDDVAAEIRQKYEDAASSQRVLVLPGPGGLVRALAQFQKQLPKIVTKSTAKVEKDGRTLYTYDYADLADVANAVLPALAACGLTYSTRIDMKARTLVCQLRHVDGEVDESTWLLPDTMDPKLLGSQITYGRRYCLLAMTGVHPTGEDDDGDRATEAASRRAARPSQDEEMTQQQRTEAQAVAPLAAVIAVGRRAGMTDGQIKLDLDHVAKGRDHGQLTKDELRVLYRDYVEAAKVVAELAEQTALQEQAEQAERNGAHVPDDLPMGDKRTVVEVDALAERPSDVDTAARPAVGDEGVFVQAGAVVNGGELSTEDTASATGNETVASLRRQIAETKAKADAFAAAQRKAAADLAEEGDDGRVAHRSRKG